MTLIVGLKIRDAVVLAADSQGTHAKMRTKATKLFRSPAGIAWGTAGPLNAAQVLYPKLEEIDLPYQPDRDPTRRALRESVLATAAELQHPEQGPAGYFAGLFAWYSSAEGRPYLLRVDSGGQFEFFPQFGAVGSSAQLADFGFFGFSRAEYLDYDSLPLESAKMLAHTVADDAVSASAQLVDGPIQLAVVTASQSTVLAEQDLAPVRDTANAFRMEQAELLNRTGRPAGAGQAPRGLRPG